MNEKINSFLAGTNPLANGPTSGWQSQLEGLAGGIGATLVFPSALQYDGKFWDIHSRYQLLDGLTNGFGSATGDYSFAQDR